MKQIFINLPVQNLEKSMNFYNEIGFDNYPLFTDENQKCVVWSEHIFLMLQSRKFFISGNNKQIADTKTNISASFTLPVESTDQVNKIVERALMLGGREPIPMRDEGFMTVRSIEDLDGHIWGIIHLDIEKFKELKPRYI